MNKNNLFMDLIKALLLVLLAVVFVVLYYKIYVVNACKLLGIEPTIKNMLTVSFFMSK